MRGRPTILIGRSISEGGRAGSASEDGAAGTGEVVAPEGVDEGDVVRPGVVTDEGAGDVIFLEGPQD